MNPVVVIKDGPLLNHTIASICYSYYGNPRHTVEYLVCNNWKDGFVQAKAKTEHALFVNAGTVFYDFDKFCQDLDNYPQKGLIGHLTDPMSDNEYYYLHDQCFYLNTNMFSEEDFSTDAFIAPCAKRSKQNIHHDYTPIAITRCNDTKNVTPKRFGERLIARVLEQSGLAVNFHWTLRETKQYLYNDELVKQWLEFNSDYMLLAESQLWVFNNEHWPLVDQPSIVCPGSGQFWMFNALNGSQVHVTDVSAVQVEFVKELWHNWDGNNYGEFVYNFIKQYNLTSYNLGETSVRDKVETIKLMQRKYFVDTVNTKFDEVLREYNIKDFVNCWQQAKSQTQVTASTDNIVTYNASGYVWTSNVDTYKYTFLISTVEEINEFTRRHNKSSC
jgi:hypothetical protein